MMQKRTCTRGGWNVRAKQAKRGMMMIALACVMMLLISIRILRLARQETPTELPSGGIEETTIDFQSAILGESREQQMYVVLEQDVNVESRISQTVLDLSIFQKTRTVQSYGTGCYAVDLAGMTEDDITVDDTKKIVSVAIPHAVLYAVEYDIANSTFVDDKQGLLAFGELKLTLEQTNELQKSIDDALRATLTSKEMFELADETASEKVELLFAPVVQALAEDYSVRIVLKASQK